MRKVNEENERIKRRYLSYLRRAKRKDIKTVEKAAEAILRYEASTHYAPFKSFKIDHVLRFRDKLDQEVSKTTGKPLAKSTVAGILAANKGFIFWLAEQQGFKSRIRHSDADYFNMDAKGRRAASAVRERPYPSLEMARCAFDAMPNDTDIQRRDKALFAFLMITAARDGAASSLRLKHINLIDGYVFQDGRDVRTKASKTITTYFLPVDPVYSECFADWVRYLQKDKLFGPSDALFPPPEMGHVNGEFRVVGLKRSIYANANAVCAAIKKTFVDVGLPIFTPHSLRTTLVKWGIIYYPGAEEFKAFSQNIGHSDVSVTLNSYCPVSLERQGVLIKKRRS